jgi:hypothetical protein
MRTCISAIARARRSPRTTSRENITSQLQQLAHWGVSGVMSTGTDVGDLIFSLRAETSAPAYGGTIIRTAWRGIAAPEGGPFPPMRAAPFGAKTEGEARADVRELAAKKADMVKIWVTIATAPCRSSARRCTARSSTKRTSASCVSSRMR